MVKKIAPFIALVCLSQSCQSLTPLTTKQQLGELLYTDTNLSTNRNQSCATCHSLNPIKDPISGKITAPAFVDPANVAQGVPVSRGSIDFATGSLNTPSVGYALFSPKFHWDGSEGLYIGGQFWNGRSQDLADQAKQPFLNPVEMAMPNKWAVVSRLKESETYQTLFWQIYQINLNEIPHIKFALFKQQAPEQVDAVYDRMAEAIAEFEKSGRFRKFNAKFDFVMAGKTRFTALEKLGLEVFNDENKGNCAACHISEMPMDGQSKSLPPLFTDFTYDNLGLPRNIKIPGNPKPDLGLCGRPEITKLDPKRKECGKHKVMSLRNIALTAPYGHNGMFDTLEQVVHFYNTRDTLGKVKDNLDPGFGVTGWPEPEVAINVNTDELGDLGLTAKEEKALVAFMKTLTDDYPAWGNDPLIPPGTPSPFTEGFR